MLSEMVNHGLGEQRLETRRIFSIRKRPTSVESPMAHGLGPSFPFRVALTFSPYNVSLRGFKRRHRIDRTVDVRVGHTS